LHCRNPFGPERTRRCVGRTCLRWRRTNTTAPGRTPRARSTARRRARWPRCEHVVDQQTPWPQGRQLARTGQHPPAGWPNGPAHPGRPSPPAARHPQRLAHPDEPPTATHLGASRSANSCTRASMCDPPRARPPRTATARAPASTAGAERHAAGPVGPPPAHRQRAGQQTSQRPRQTPAAAFLVRQQRGPQRAAVGTTATVGGSRPARPRSPVRRPATAGSPQRHIGHTRPPWPAHSRRIRRAVPGRPAVTSSRNRAPAAASVGRSQRQHGRWPRRHSAPGDPQGGVVHNASPVGRSGPGPGPGRVRRAQLGSRPRGHRTNQLAPAAQIVGAEAPQPVLVGHQQRPPGTGGNGGERQGQVVVGQGAGPAPSTETSDTAASVAPAGYRRSGRRPASPPRSVRSACSQNSGRCARHRAAGTGTTAPPPAAVHDGPPHPS